MDAATGLVYAQQRYYDPQVGRFLSPDPANADFNRYNYASNNPYRFVDLDGRESACFVNNTGCGLRPITEEDERKQAIAMGGLTAIVLTAGAAVEYIPATAGFFGTRVVQQEVSREARRGIKSLEKQIQKHLEKIRKFKENPTVKPGMEKMSKEAIEGQQQRRVELLEKEIQKFRNNIEKLKNPPPPPQSSSK